MTSPALAILSSGDRLPPALPPPPTPEATTGATSSVTTTTATLNGTVNPNGFAISDYHFEWGTTAALGTPTSSGTLSSGSVDQAVSRNISGLSAGLIYYYRLVATSSSGTDSGAIRSFTTDNPGDPLLRSDPMTNPTVAQVWGSLGLDSFDSSRIVTTSTGGFGGGPQRAITVQDGDDLGLSGVRAEIGNNASDHGYATPSDTRGTFFLYESGTRRITTYAIKLPTGYPLSNSNYQLVTQMKQAQPYGGVSNDSPILALEALNGLWKLRHHPDYINGQTLWSTPATLNEWVEVEWDVTYSRFTSVGKVKLTLTKPSGNVTSGTITDQTLAYATTADDGYTIGQAIPSHLRIGVYHHSSVPNPVTVLFGPVEVRG